MPSATKDLIAAYETSQTADAAAATALTKAQTDKDHTAVDVTTAAAALSADLQANGPAVVLSADLTSVTLYAAATASPGFTVTTVRVA